MTLEERIKQMLAESEKEETVAVVAEKTSDTPKHAACVKDDGSIKDKAKHAAKMNESHGVSIVFANDEIQYGADSIGALQNALIDHHGSLTEAKENHPEYFHTEETIVEAKRTDVSAQVSSLLEAEGLSEDFKLQAVTIFEAAVSDRVMQLEEDMKKEYQESLDEAIASMEKHIDGFMSEIVQEWMSNNKLAVETNFKHKLQESFMDGLSELLAEHNIELPAESENALDVAIDQISALEESVTAAAAREAELISQISEMKAAAIMEGYRSRMPATTFDRFVQLSENITFKDESQYARQLDIVYENFGKVSNVVEHAPAQTAVAHTPVIQEDLHESESVAFYANYMSK